jgi:hypothetical protein
MSQFIEQLKTMPLDEKTKIKVSIKTFGCTCADAQVLPREGSRNALYAEPQVLMDIS